MGRTIRLLRDRSALSARRVFLASILYLTLLLGLLVVDRGPASGTIGAMAAAPPVEVVPASLGLDILGQ